MRASKIYISTVASDATEVARRCGFGLELAEFCTAWNLDDHLEETDARVRQEIDGVARKVLHGPFNELFPCAIDPKARELAAYRYRQAVEAALRYGATKIVIHGGYQIQSYYDCWYTEQSILFWRSFLKTLPPVVTVCLENVFEPEPELLAQILEGVDSPSLRICLDVGHVNAYSKRPLEQWVERLRPWLSHFHLHNNEGDADRHNSLFDGTIDIKSLLQSTADLDATYTLEVLEAEPSAMWLAEQGVLED